MARRLTSFRRLMALTAALAGTSLVVAACGGFGSNSDTDAGTEHIRVLLAAQPTALDPIVGTRAAQVVWATIIEPLIDMDEDLEPTDTGLVTNWTRTDPTTWT